MEHREFGIGLCRALSSARVLGLSSSDVANQIRSAFYGREAIREQRGRNEIKVMVRLPEERRRSMLAVDELRHLEFEERADELRMAARHNDLRPLTLAAHLQDISLDPVPPLQPLVGDPLRARENRLCVAEVEEIVPRGSLDPDCIHLPGIYVHRIIQGEHEKRIEQRTVRKREAV